MDLLVAATAFALILPVELPDKTFVATLVLSTRYPALPVWLGVVGAFLVQCLVAVTAGELLSQLPPGPVLAGAAVLFAVGAVLLLRGADSEDTDAGHAETSDDEPAGSGGGAATRTPVTGVRAAGASFAVLFLAEWGDLSQLLTAGLAARTGDPVSVFAGAWLALAVVAGAAVVLGRALLRRMRLATVRRVGGVVCAVLAAITGWEAVSTLTG